MSRSNLYNSNRDIVDWMVDQLADSDYDPEMLYPVVEKLYGKAVESFNGKESEFEESARRFIRMEISKFKLSGGESKFRSEDELELNFVSEEDSEENNSESTI